MNRSTLISLPKTKTILLIAIIILHYAQATSMEPDYNCDDYLHTQEGTLPLIITVPHGGGKEIPGFAMRQSGVTKKDIRTLELAEEISEELKHIFGKVPYLVAALFSRKCIDANRSEKNAFEDQKLAPLYHAYHHAIKQLLIKLMHQYPDGVLLLDIHGQGREPLVIHRGTKNVTTVKKFISRHGLSGISGEKSILGRLAKKDYRIFPPENELNTIPESTHFDGGFTVREYGKDGIDAMQIEFGTEFREKSELRKKLVTDFSEVLMLFLKDYYLK